MSKPLEIKWPVGGIDLGYPQGDQAPRTCPDALNVVSFPSPFDTETGGKRWGTVQAFQALSGTPSKVTGLAVVGRNRIPATIQQGALVAVVDNMGDYGDSFQAPPNFRGQYIGFRRWFAAGGCSVATWPNTSGSGAGAATPARRAWMRPPGDQYAPTGALVLVAQPNKQHSDGAANNLGGETGVAINYATNNNLMVRLRADTRALGYSANNQYGCTSIGPFVRGSNDLTSMVMAYLEWTGASDSVRLVIDRMTPTAATRLKTSTKVVSLKGLYGGDKILDGPFLRLSADSNSITASIEWPSSLPGGVSYVDSITVTNDTTYATQNRAGVLYRDLNTVNPDASLHNPTYTERFVRQLEYSRRDPYDYGSVSEMVAPLTPPDTNPANYFVLPAGFRSTIAAIAGGAFSPTKATGLAISAAINTYPVVDTNLDGISAITNNNQTSSTQTIAPTTATPAGKTYAVDLLYDETISDLAANCDQQNPIFLMSEDGSNFHKFMLRVELERTAGVTDKNSRQAYYSQIRVVAISDSGTGGRTRTVILNNSYGFGTSNKAAILFSTVLPVRWVIEGSGVSARLNCCENQMLLASIDYQNATWTAITTKPAGSFVGIDVTRDTGAVMVYSKGFRVVDVTASTGTDVAGGRDVVRFANGVIEYGPIGTVTVPGTLTAASGPTLTGSQVQAAALDGKLYCVDGSSSRIVDTAKGLVTDWLNVSNTDYDLHELVCEWRGRIVIARRYNALAGWYMTRVKAPTDLNLGGDGEATRAYAGTDPTVGQPGDEITALIPWRDDLLIFGCATSLYVMRGDPGAGGRCETLITGAGVLGARSWCFDELGNLYMMGPGGFYIIPAGATTISSVSGRRFTKLVERLNTSTTQVQMCYDAFKHHVHIFLTPTDGVTQGTHLVYETTRNAMWKVRYPLSFGPTAVCSITGSVDEDRRFLMGGLDGVIRRPSDSATDDDGEPIDAWIRFAPVNFDSSDQLMKAVRIQSAGLKGSGPLAWYMMTGNSFSDAVEVPFASADATGTWFGSTTGLQNASGLSVTGRYHGVALRQTSKTDRFSLDELSVEFRPAGKARVWGG